MRKMTFLPIWILALLFLLFSPILSQKKADKRNYPDYDKTVLWEKTYHIAQPWDSIVSAELWENAAEIDRTRFRDRFLTKFPQDELNSSEIDSLIEVGWNRRVISVRWDSLSNRERYIVNLAYTYWYKTTKSE